MWLCLIWKSEGGACTFGAWRVTGSIFLTNELQQYLRLILTCSSYHFEAVGKMWAFHVE